MLLHQEAMTPFATATDFLEALQASPILDATQLHELTEAQWDDAPAIAVALVDRGWLTPFQARFFLEGRGNELVLGTYRILDRIGEGGMGQVYKATHQRLHRVVALKVIRPERLSKDVELVKRFQREAQLAAQLSHPNVVIVYDFDQIDDTHFIAMEYVEGVDLSQLVRAHGPLPIDYACEFIRQASLGLQHAHERGLIHRDIKPSNLLVTMPPAKHSAAHIDTDDKPPLALSRHNVVKILDMGLARLAEGVSNDVNSFQTQAGTVMGTPDFIAPEQARNASTVDHRADLYSLGCTFYFLLTGQAPFPEGSVVEKLLMHQLDDPKPVTELRPEVPPHAIEVLQKLMAKQPAQRYQSAQEVAEALAGHSVAEQAISGLRPAPLPQPAPPEPKQAAMPPLDETDDTRVFSVTPHASAVDKPPDQEKAKSRERDKDKEKRSDVPEPARLIADLKGHRGWVMSTAFSSDRKLLATGGVHGAVRLWGFSSSVPKDQVLPQAHAGEVHALAFSNDVRLLASGSGSLDGIVWVWDLTDKNAPRHLVELTGHKAPISALDFSHNGKLLASASLDKTIQVWDLFGKGHKECSVLKGHTDGVLAVKFALAGDALASGGQDGTVRLWSLGRLWSSELAVLHGHSGPVHCVAYSPDAKLLASGSLDQTIRLWDLSGNQPRQRAVFKGHDDVVRQVLFPPDGETLVSVGNRGHIILWNINKETRVREWPFRLMSASFALTHDGRYFAAGKTDGVVAVFRLYPRKKGDSSSD